MFAVRQDPGHTAKALFAVCQDPRHTANSAFAVCPGPRHTSNNFLQNFLTELITFEKLFHNILSNEHWKHISKDTEQLMVYDSNQKILLFHAFQIV